MRAPRYAGRSACSPIFPFTCRKATEDTPFLRELVISFGRAGHVALFEITDDAFVTVLAIRYQRERDYL